MPVLFGVILAVCGSFIHLYKAICLPELQPLVQMVYWYIPALPAKKGRRLVVIIQGAGVAQHVTIFIIYGYCHPYSPVLNTLNVFGTCRHSTNQATAPLGLASNNSLICSLGQYFIQHDQYRYIKTIEAFPFFVLLHWFGISSGYTLYGYRINGTAWLINKIEVSGLSAANALIIRLDETHLQLTWSAHHPHRSGRIHNHCHRFQRDYLYIKMCCLAWSYNINHCWLPSFSSLNINGSW